MPAARRAKCGDSLLPFEATSRRLPALLKNVRSTIIAGGPHAIIWTHADEVRRCSTSTAARAGPDQRHHGRCGA
jgi:hypothetical protein